MKQKFYSLLFLAFLPLFALAQGSSLTIFSEDGDKFTLYLNGAQQNNNPQTNLRMDGLTQQFYSARIVFEDKAKAPISKSISVTDPGTNAPADIVYKIKKKDGEMKLRYFSAQPVQPNYTPPADVYVVHYGQPDQTTTVTQTTVTQTGTNSGNGGVSIGVSMGGVNMNVNANDPNARVTQTTTTTTTSSYSSNSEYSTPPPASNGCSYPMDLGSFKSAKETVKNASFDDTKLSTAQGILASNCFSTDQVIQICQLFGFEETKLKFAKFAYNKTTDRNNYFKVGNIFSFDASKTELNDFISNGGR
jgi:hypothetical protein